MLVHAVFLQRCIALSCSAHSVLSPLSPALHLQKPPTQLGPLLPNPQTDEFLASLGLYHVVTVPCPGFQPRYGGRAGAGGGTGGDARAEGNAAGFGRDAAVGEGAGAGEAGMDLDAATQDPNEIQLDNKPVL